MAPPPTRLPKITTPIMVLIGLGGLGLIALAYVLFFYNDLSNAIARAKARHLELKSEEASAAAAYKAYLEDATKLEEKKARARDLNKVLPETSEMASFLAALNQQAEIAGLKVRAVLPGDEQNQQFYARVPVKLDLVGRYHQLAKFFAGVGRIDRIINVENIELSSPKLTANDETVLQARCLTTTFHTVRPSASSAPAAPGAPGAPGAPK